MGQDNTKPDIQQKYATTGHSSILPSARKTPLPPLKLQQRVECEGLLTLRTTPFNNCIQIETQSQVLFIQNIETSLKTLLESRLNTNRLFMIDDIEKLIQTVTFTLAFLQEKNITYHDVASEHIFYDSGNFKLMPNELIENNTYQRLKLGDEVLPSPELIIALRCGEDDVTDDDIIEKSNVFILGMTLLEVCTLHPSFECYDPQNYDILDSVINERLTLVEEYYGDKIARILANMLDYDYSQRMTLKQMSIWINRQLQPSKEREQTQEPISTSIMNSKAEKAVEPKPTPTQNTSMVNTMDKSKSRLTKNNSVYMNPNKQNAQNFREERNKIYIRDSSRTDTLMNPANYLYEGQLLNKRQDSFEAYTRTQEKRQYYNPSFTEGDSFKFMEPAKHELKHPNPYCQDFIKLTQKKDDFDRYMEKAERDTTKRVVSKEPTQGYRVRDYQEAQVTEESSRGQTPYDIVARKEQKVLKEVVNQYYPNIEDILKSKASHESKGQDLKGPLRENAMVNKIKEQIAKSRKFIEDIKINKELKF